MAFNIQTFKIRALTSVFFVSVMLIGLLWNKWSFIVLFAVIHTGCWFEFLKLLRKIKPQGFEKYTLLGLLYITLPILLLIDLRLNGFENETEDFLKIIPCGIIFSIWINDTMAYIVGSFTGKTPMTKISPKKTWEGTIGGAILSILVITLLGWYFKIYSIKDWICIAAICAVFATIGDLLESKLKRLANVKDSGTIMPGHGGFLDRFDSLLIAAPIVWLYVNFLM